MMRENDKKIIQYFIETNNKPEYPAEISRNAKLNRGEITRRCVALEEAGILVSELKDAPKRKKTPHYSLNESIDTLRTIGTDISMNVLAECMQLDFYDKLIPEIIDLFDTKLKTQCGKSLSDYYVKFLHHQMRYTVSGLTFILNDSDYNASIFNNKSLFYHDNTTLLRYGYEWGVKLAIQQLDHTEKSEADAIGHIGIFHEETMHNELTEVHEYFIITYLFNSFVWNDVSIGYIKDFYTGLIEEETMDERGQIEMMVDHIYWELNQAKTAMIRDKINSTYISRWDHTKHK